MTRYHLLSTFFKIPGEIHVLKATADTMSDTKKNFCPKFSFEFFYNKSVRIYTKITCQFVQNIVKNSLKIVKNENSFGNFMILPRFQRISGLKSDFYVRTFGLHFQILEYTEENNIAVL